MSNNLFVPDKDGKLKFIGKDDPSNPPTEAPAVTTLECPICHAQVPYLVGDDTPDGGKRGCESDWVRPTKPQTNNDEPSTEISFD